MFKERITRREAVKIAAYVTPVIITMAANFSFASAGSGATSPKKEKNDNWPKLKKDKD